MFVACPSCRSLYQIELAHLRAADGQLRCGSCDTTFDATAAVFDDPQQALDYQYPLQEEVAREIDDLVSRALDQVPSAGEAEESSIGDEIQAIEEPEQAIKDLQHEVEEVGGELDQSPIPEEEPLVEEIVIETIEEPGAYRELRADMDFYAQPLAAEFRQREPDSPDEAELSLTLLLEEPEREAAARTSWGAIAASLLLTFILLGQYAYVERYGLAQSPELRSALEIFCRQLKCDLPLRHDPGSIEIVEREVRDHPNVDDALLINTTFVNRADYVQAFPLFQVSFSDVSGTPVAVRRFTPEEYIATQRDLDAGIAPGEQQHLMLEVIDPGNRAVSFQFDFL